MNANLSIEEAVKQVRNEKRFIKKEKQFQIMEKRFAMEREEILQKLSNKPVKIHPRGDKDLGIFFFKLKFLRIFRRSYKGH